MPPKIGQLTCLKSLSTFIVGSKEGYHITEIRDLELAGELHIKGLENTASALDAKDANLIGKKDLQCLELSWNSNVEKESLNSDAQQVLEALQPHSNLKGLKIKGYLGVQFPYWMTNIANFTSLSFLEMVLPIELVNLIALEELRIESCPELESFPEQFLEGLRSLRALRIICCKKFRSLSESVQHLTLLELLVISRCPNLVSLRNGMNHLNRLHTLTIRGGYPNCKVPQGLERIPYLRSLNLRYLDEVASLPDSLGGLTTL
ncbi:hypothetical protein L6164_008908 [Bauhinia variegata]|uniref:Uncharacterized protein n=1 Tax=Bauhinia variegata TaxID=167791 RepID=A0ACB9PH19_BAUVA|nr:hypothetical protein L6164_008908 [Bauhinia variegata]